MPEQQSKQSVDRAAFVRLLIQRLRYRWLSDAHIVHESIKTLFGRKHQRCRQLVAEIVTQHRAGGLRTETQLRKAISKHSVIRQLFKSHDTIVVTNASGDSALNRWPVPPISNLNQLADFLMLGSPDVVRWLTLPHHRRQSNIDHYQRRSLKKRDGSIRWIEQPKPVLKRVQRTIHCEMVSRIPVHSCVHGFCRGRNTQTATEPHVGKAGVLRMDLQDFFGSIHTARVRSLFCIAGYSLEVADTLAKLCTAPCANPADAQPNLRRSRLPQGAPTSPGIANAIAFRLDRRLAGLSRASGFEYTRFADDLIFSGDETILGKGKRFATSTAAIVMEEGFHVNFHKTKLMNRGSRQSVLGVVVNQRQNVPRRDYERLKAVLHNCQRHGAQSQNRDNHPQFRESVRGQIAHVAHFHPQRGDRLMQVFDQVDWN